MRPRSKNGVKRPKFLEALIKNLAPFVSHEFGSLTAAKRTKESQSWKIFIVAEVIINKFEVDILNKNNTRFFSVGGRYISDPVKFAIALLC